jgi:hypothetical protein
MTATFRPVLPPGTRRKVLFWRYDDEDDRVVDVVPSQDAGLADVEMLLAGDAAEEVEPPRPSDDDVTGSLTSLAASEVALGHIRRYNAALAGFHTPDFAFTSDFGTYAIEVKSPVVGGVKDLVNQVHMYGGELARLWNRESITALVEGYQDIYSSALTDLTNVSWLIDYINSDLRETMRTLISAYVRDHGYAYCVEVEPDSTGLAFTDDTADYPPAPRNYSNVKVRISGADKIKPRRYTDEDHQAWGDVSLDAD